MRFIISLLVYSFLSSCSLHFSAKHQNFDKFSKDVTFCLERICALDNNSFLDNILFITPVLAYGGGGGSGGGSNDTKINKLSYEAFNLCLKEKGYVKDDDGIFKLPLLKCK